MVEISQRYDSIVEKFSKNSQLPSEISVFDCLNVNSALYGIDFMSNMLGDIESSIESLVRMPLSFEKNWSCAVCTFENVCKDKCCAMCGTVAPADCVHNSVISLSDEVISTVYEETRTMNISKTADSSKLVSTHTIECKVDSLDNGCILRDKRKYVDFLEIDPVLFSPIVAHLTGKRLGLVENKKAKKAKLAPEASISADERKSTSAGTVLRAGKSRFIGVDGEVSGVEDMVKVSSIYSITST